MTTHIQNINFRSVNTQLIIDSVSLAELKKPNFWSQLYLQNLKPLPVCDICHKTIQDCQKWLAFTCD
jgi:hypothetical protein